MSQGRSSVKPHLASLAMEALAEGVMLVDAHGCIEYVNHAFAEGVGLSVRELCGRQWDDPAIRVTDREGAPIPHAERPMSIVLETGRPVLGYEYDLYRQDGRRISVDVNAVPIIEDGHLTGAVVTFTDVSKRAAAETALRESEARLRAFVDQSRYGFFIADAEGEAVVYNRAMEALTGHSIEEVREVGWLAASYPDPDERARIVHQAEQTIKGEVPYIEEPYLRPDGKLVWLSYSMSPVRLRGKGYAAGIVSDVTKRKEAEQRIRFQSSLLEHVRNAVVASDSSGCLTYVNADAERLYGTSADEMLGRDVGDFLAPSAGVSREELTRRVLANEHWEGEATVRRRDGSEIPVLLAVGQLVDEVGDPSGFVGVSSDISDIKSAQHELEEKDRAIRQAYVDVVSAVTGGKLVLMTRRELDDALGREIAPRESIRYDTLSSSRRRLRELMEREGIVMDPHEAIVAYGEAANNALKHAGGGHSAAYETERALQVLVSDDGPGIDFRMLPHATLTAGFSTKQTLGIGFSIMLEIADRMLLTTQTGCTVVVLEFARGKNGEAAG